MSNRRIFLFGEVPAAYATALLKSVRGTPSSRLLAWLSDTPSNREGSVDIARFARIVTSDPTRIDGASSGRVEEYQTRDVFLETALAPAPDGSYVIPVTEEGMGSIGMVWWERRPIDGRQSYLPSNDN
jgi:hypothetical protein